MDFKEMGKTYYMIDKEIWTQDETSVRVYNAPDHNTSVPQAHMYGSRLPPPRWHETGAGTWLPGRAGMAVRTVRYGTQACSGVSA